MVGQYDRLTGEDGEDLPEGTIEVRTIELVDNEPLVGTDGSKKVPLFESGPLGLQRADSLPAGILPVDSICGHPAEALYAW